MDSCGKFNYFSTLVDLLRESCVVPKIKPDIEEALNIATKKGIAGVTGITGLTRLSGGASQETWAFDAIGKDEPIPLILRRSPDGKPKEVVSSNVSLESEAHIQDLALAHNVKVARVQYSLQEQDNLGPGYVMDRIEGETIARKILRDEKYKKAREVLAGHCGTALASMRNIPIESLKNEIRTADARGQVEVYREEYDSIKEPHPVFELAFRYLEERATTTNDLYLVHGDFRNGNIIVGVEGLRAILDWEMAHLGDPMEDLGWLCVNSWRYGHLDKPVGGFGYKEQLFEAYEEASGVKVDPEQVRFWEVFGSLKWGVICQKQAFSHLDGSQKSMERAAIGRRCSEAEIDLMMILEEEFSQ